MYIYIYIFAIDSQVTYTKNIVGLNVKTLNIY